MSKEEEVEAEWKWKNEQYARRVEDAALETRQEGRSHVNQRIPQRHFSSVELLAQEVLERDEEADQIPIRWDSLSAQQIPKRDRGKGGDDEEASDAPPSLDRRRIGWHAIHHR